MLRKTDVAASCVGVLDRATFGMRRKVESVDATMWQSAQYMKYVAKQNLSIFCMGAAL